MEKLQIGQLPYSEDIKPISDCFKNLNSIDKVYWKSEKIGDGVLGPSSYWIKGFVCISEEEKADIISSFDFKDISLTFVEGVAPEITGYTDFRWKTSTEFSQFLFGFRFVGEAYIDVINNVIYIDAEKA